MQRSGSERVALAGLLRPEAFGQGGDAPYDILLREWIAFHRLAGVSRFYLCRCTANPLDAPRDDSVVGCVLEPLVGAGILVLDTCQGAGVHDHTHDGAMAKEDETARYVSYCIGRCRDEPLWVAPADAPCTYLVPAATATTAIATERPLIGDALAKLAAHDARPNRTCGAVSVPVHHRDGVPPIYSILVGHAIRENSHTTARHDTVPQGAEGDHEEVVAHRVIVRSESVSIMTTTAEPVFEAADRGHAPMNPCVARDGTSSGGDLLVFYNHRRARHARDGPHEPKEPVHAAYTATRWPAILARAWPEGDARASSAGSLAEGMDRLGLMSPELGTLGEMARFALDAVAARSLCLTPLPKAAAKREMGSAPADDNALSSTQKSMERRWGASVRTLVAGQPRVCIVMHIGYAAEWPFYRQHLLNVVRAQIAFDLYVTVTEGQQSPSLDADLRAFGAMGSHTGVGSTGRDTNGTQGHARAERYIDAAPHHFTPGQEEEEEEHAMQSAGVLSGQTDNHTAIIRVPNRGLDGGAWLLAMRAAMRHASAIGTPYDVVLKMHTKRPHLYGPEWRRELIEAIVGSPERVADCIATLLTDPSVGMLCAQDWIISEEPRQCVFDMAVRMGMDAARPHEMTEPLAFCGGTMFWARFDALADPLERCLFDALAASLTPGYPRGIDSDGHFIERALCVMVRRAHLTIKGVERLRPPLAMGLGETPALFDPSLAHLLGVTVPVAGDASTESISTDAARTHHPIRSLIRFAVERWIHARSGHTQTCTATACPWGLSLVPPNVQAADRRVAVVRQRAAMEASLTSYGIVGRKRAMRIVLQNQNRQANDKDIVGTIETAYANSIQQETAIYQHIPTLYGYAKQCAHIVELGGTDLGHATVALLRGLLHNADAALTRGMRPCLISVDKTLTWQMERTLETSRKSIVNHEVRLCESTADTDLPYTDMLFIDSWHVFAHMEAELERHHGRVRRWIVMHDTTVDGVSGESVRMNHPIAEEAKQTGYLECDIRRGVWQAIIEFVDAHRDEWRLERRWAVNNGLTVLARVSVDAS